jgi:hypothetical protein
VFHLASLSYCVCKPLEARPTCVPISLKRGVWLAGGFKSAIFNADEYLNLGRWAVYGKISDYFSVYKL